jgi:hypothetical protein
MKTLKTALAASVLLTIVGCQNTPDQPREITATNQEQKDNSYALYQSAKTLYRSWLTTLKEAEGLKLYSKERYSKLLSSWNEAVDIYQDIATDPAKAAESYSLFSDGSYAENFSARVAVVENHYQALLQLKETADDVLSDAIAQMAYLDKIKAAEVHPTDYKHVERRYKALFKDVEDGDLDDAQSGQVTFLAKAKQLELKVVIKRYVYPLKKKLRELRHNDLDEVAAISYAKAKAEIDTTEQTIRSNPRDLEIIESAVEDAEFELAHVRSVALEVKRLAKVDDEEFEPVVLEFENKLLAISQDLNGADYRDKSLRMQAESILQSISLLSEEQDEASSAHSQKVRSFTQQLSKLKLKSELLTEEKEKAEQQKSALQKKISQLEVQLASQQTLLAAYQQQLTDKEPLADKAPAETVAEKPTQSAVTEGSAADQPEAGAEAEENKPAVESEPVTETGSEASVVSGEEEVSA